MIRSPTLTRRRLLQSTGLAAGSLFLPSLLSRRAQAQGAPPRRIIIFFTQHGTVYPSWRLRPGGQGEDVAFEADLASMAENEFSPILQPLYAHRNKLTVLDGLAVTTAEADEFGNEHIRGTAHALTGKMMVNGSGGGASIDQIVAEQIAVAGRVNSLELAVVSTASGGAVYRGPGQALPADADANGAFQRLFPVPVGGGGEPEEETPADRVSRAQPAVLDFVAREYERLAPRLSGEDRQKLAAHRDLVRDVEERVRGLQGLTCARPGEPELNFDFSSPAFYDTRFDAMASIIAAAVGCDLTRVVTLQMGQLLNEHCGAGPGDIHADFAHQHEIEPAATVMTNYGRVHAQQFASLLSLLDALPEGNGTVLDNTLVVWCGELANGTHSFLRWPVVIGGGGNMGLDTGRYVRWPATNPTPNRHPEWSGVEQVVGPPHNRLWVSLAAKLGVSLDAVGESEVFTTEGERLDCATPLDRI